VEQVGERFWRWGADLAAALSPRASVGQGSPVTPVTTRSGILAFVDPGRRPRLTPASRRSHHAQRCCGRVVRLDVGDGIGGRIPGFVGGPRTVRNRGEGGAYHSSRVEGGALVTEALRIVLGCRGDQADSNARGRPSRRAHPQRYVLRLSPDDGGAPAPRSMLRILGVKVQARWIPSAVNRYADALSRLWDVGDVCAMEALVESLCSAHEPDAVVFPYRPAEEHPIARRKYQEVQMREDWGDGRARLWNPPFDMLPVVLKMEDERARGVLIAPWWPAQPWYGRLSRLSTRMRVLDPARTSSYLAGQRPLNPGWELVVAEIGPSRHGAPLFGMRC
jgi:hypothetical protein